jgi:hypothetical protein
MGFGPPDLNSGLANLVRLAGLREPIHEFPFGGLAGNRRWRIDLAWPDARLAVEIDGGTFTGGRHVRGVGAEGDRQKRNELVLAGWRVLVFTSKINDDGRALDAISRALEEFPVRARLAPTTTTTTTPLNLPHTNSSSECQPAPGGGCTEGPVSYRSQRSRIGEWI